MREGKPIHATIVAADVRKSTFVMKEAMDFGSFAATIGRFVVAAKKHVREGGGWWDRFTGDGFLAYWIHSDDPDDDDMSARWNAALQSCSQIFEMFYAHVVPALRSNSRNFPAGVGLSIGIDCGPAQIAAMAGDATIVGLPVVGAVRMVSAAAPGEVLANVYVGEALQRHLDCCFEHLESVVRDHRATKEYDSQEVYIVKPRGLSGPA